MGKFFSGVDEDWYKDFTEHEIDFKQPDNFVKLLELIYSNCGGIDSFIKEKYFVDDFLEHILKAIKNADKNHDGFILLLQQAQNIEWKY